jgi:hypothetical protein
VTATDDIHNGSLVLQSIIQPVSLINWSIHFQLNEEAELLLFAQKIKNKHKNNMRSYA